MKKSKRDPRKLDLDSKARQIINKYNNALGIKFAPGDYNYIDEKVDNFQLIESFMIASTLEYIWENMADKGTIEKVKGKDRRISAFIKYKVLKEAVKKKSNIFTAMTQKTDMQLDSFFRHHLKKIQPVSETMGYNCDILGRLEPNNPNDYLTPKKEREIRCNIYEKFAPTWLPEEDIDDMIHLEAI